MNLCLQINDLTKIYKTKKGNLVRALDNTTIDVYENDFVCIVGPSGCGKSTLLRIIAGLESATTGRVLYKGKEIEGTTGDIGMVFQQYSLLPWKMLKTTLP